MATVKNGPNGGFSGKVGSVVGSSWRGIDYIRSLPARRKSPPTSDEAANRSKFGFTQKWLNHFAAFYSIGFMNYSRTMTAGNAAMSWNSKNAVSGTAPNFQIDYPSVLLSDGPLQAVNNTSIQLVSETEILLSWETSYGRKAKSNDQLLLVAFCPELNASFFSIGEARRSSLQHQIEIPKIFRSRHVEIFIAFCSWDMKMASRSQYLGNISLRPKGD